MDVPRHVRCMNRECISCVCCVRLLPGFAMRVVEVSKAGILNGVLSLGSEEPYQRVKKCIADRLSNNLFLLCWRTRETQDIYFSDVHSTVH